MENKDQETIQVNTIITGLSEYQRIYLLRKLNLSNNIRRMLEETGLTEDALSEKWDIPMPELKELLLGTHDFDLRIISKIEARYDEFIKSN